jgi:hypothetical protein
VCRSFDVLIKVEVINLLPYTSKRGKLNQVVFVRGRGEKVVWGAPRLRRLLMIA